MENQMKEALLKVCEKYADKNVDVNVDFAYDLVQNVIEVSTNKIDDALLPAILATKDFVKSSLKNLVDKIDGEEGNLGE